jgi:glutamate dehydrogenase
VGERADQEKQHLLAALSELVASRFPDNEVPRVTALMQAYYREAAPIDLVDRDPVQLYGAALGHWRLAQHRQAGVPAVRVYSPTVEDDGWESGATIVDIVTDDMAFIVDSVTMAAGVRGLDLHLLVHPIVEVCRDEAGAMVGIGGVDTGCAEPHRESFVHMEIDRLASAAARAELEADIRQVLAELRATIDDWAPMREAAERLAAELDAPGHDARRNEAAAAAELLRWMASGHFIFLGYREYDFIDDGTLAAVVSRPASGLGILRQTEATTTDLGAITAELAEEARRPKLLILTKSNAESRIHRAAPMDYVSVKEIDADGVVRGERRFLGLYTASVYSESVRAIPVLRQRAQVVVERAGFLPGSHDASHLLAILEGLPRDELFQMSDEDQLFDMALRILHLRDRRQVSLFVRRDVFGRFYSCIVHVPRDRHNTIVRKRIQDALMAAFEGVRSDFSVAITSAATARLHVLVYTRPGAVAAVDEVALERRLGQLVRTWTDDLQNELIDALGEERGHELFERWGTAFPASYQEEVLPDAAVNDILRLEELTSDDLDVILHRPLEATQWEWATKLYRTGGPLSLTSILPILHDLGFKVLDERPYELEPAGSHRCWIYDFGVLVPEGTELDAVTRRRVERSVLSVWRGETESDRLAQLVVLAGLGWDDVAVLRAYRRYQRQLGSALSQASVEEALARHPAIAAKLVALFRSRFDPAKAGADQELEQVQLRGEILEALDAVTSLDEDRALRSFLTLIDATLRTNSFSTTRDATTLSFKLDPTAIPELPRPRPFREIFVYSPRVEGVHLRGGSVARGGIRWSDRRDDFRTEILGLLKAQAVKNAVIVPVGAKGGFVPRHLPDSTDRAVVMAEVVACYETFIAALLDLTDNLIGGGIVPPADVMRLDGDDPYLVVAADKGTATFSDNANRLAVERQFWLGDAFASGGSKGYDHKVMGITARGAWESVRRHFRELGIDADHDPITVVGIGDMSGDVFGNGMLLSPHLRLIAGFDHRHIFIDPDPDPARAFAERRRLFDKSPSSWWDYDRDEMSVGGGIFHRTAKSVTLTDEMRQVLATDATTLTPTELISVILRAPADLLWNGGIGTYVRASTETNEAAADRANDGLRVTGKELRAKVVVEGGNLGLTQRARIEYALAGGRINTDAIDNSAGVDCSDHEVNIKILLDDVVRAGDLTGKQRDELLVTMTDEVAELVLADNYDQTQALSVARAQAPEMVEVHRRQIAWLEERAGLDRAVEALPTEDELSERRLRSQGLTQPELAVVMAYTKIHLTRELLEDDLPDHPLLRRELVRYFPEPIRRRFEDRLDAHPLRRELVATTLVNRLVNRGGLSAWMRLADETSASLPDVVRAVTAAWDVFELHGRWDAVEALDKVVNVDVQIAMFAEIKRLGERAARWLLRNRPTPIDLTGTIDTLAGPTREVARLLPEVLVGTDRRERTRVAERLERAGVPAGVATQIAGLSLLITALDIGELAASTGESIEDVAAVYFLLDDRLDLAWLRGRIIALPRADRWQTLARSALRDDFFRANRDLTQAVFATVADPDGKLTPRQRLDAWLETHRLAVERFHRFFADMRAIANPDLSHVSVALRELRNLIHQVR